ncbi:MAG TPA: hypothetical protein VMV48_07960 [Gallionellaceae bacterium]|nr:hypothetical protein [Gallionellaceae bacterium]
MPVPPPPVEVHEVLLVDDQDIVVLALDAIEVEAAKTDTVGTVEMIGVGAGTVGAGTAPILSAL